MTVMSEILNHAMNHEHCAMKICPFIVNRRDLTEFLDEPMFRFLTGQEKHEMINSPNGCVCTFSGVPIYLIEEEE